MPLVYTRRRFLAVAAAAAAWARPVFAQQSSAPPPRVVDGVAIRDVGSWHVTSQFLNARAWPLDSAVSVSSNGIKSGNAFDGGGAGLLLEYWGGEGPRSGYFPVLTIDVRGLISARRQARLFVDDKQVGAYDVDSQLKLDLKEVFGPDLAGLAQAKVMRVRMTVGSDDMIVYEVNLAETGTALTEMRRGPDAFYSTQPRKPPGQSPGQGQPGNCFITAACCEIVGLPDDCFELMSLRSFRDGPLAATADGRRDIRAYYALAPRIVAEVRRRGEERRLLSEYLFAILPSAVAARLGFVALPRRLYSRMMRRMMARYLG